jgi:hypothetical protein
MRDIPSRYTDAIFGVLNGNVPNPVKGAVHYSMSFSRSDSQIQAKADAQEYIDKNPARKLASVVDAGVGFKQGVNWFFTVPGSSSFKVDLVSSEKATPDIGMTLALVGTGAASLYFLSKVL